MCAVRALCPVPSGFSSGLAPAGRWGRPSTPIAGRLLHAARGRLLGTDSGYLPSEKPLLRLPQLSSTPTPTVLSRPLAVGHS